MPNPKDFTTRDSFMKVCIPQTIKDGTAKDGSQANAICSSMWERRDKKMNTPRMEVKQLGGYVEVVETKSTNNSGVEVGIVSGHIAAWTPDRGGRYGIPDKFHKGAWLNTIAEHKAQGNRQVRLKNMHGRTIGGFPIETVREDVKGLAAIGEINLEVAEGREAYALARQRVLTDFSVGFTAVRDDISGGLRNVYEAKLWEGSIVDEPIHPDANITEVKAMFHDLPIAPRETSWDLDGALARVGLVDDPSAAYIHCEEKSILIADVIEGTLVVVPTALEFAADEIKQLETSARAQAILHVERYFAKMDRPSPFDSEDRQFYGANDVKMFRPSDIERVLVGTGTFSKSAATMLANRFGVDPSMDWGKLLTEIKKISI